jgi:3-oxoacyl-[acyl-carrier-protein] synthase III
MTNDVYLHSISINAGQRRSILELANDNHRSRRIVDRLVADGFAHFCETNANLIELAEGAATNTLAMLDGQSRIDGVMFCSESTFQGHGNSGESQKYDHPVMRNRLLAILPKLGLAQARPYANSMSACGNLGPTLLLGKSLLATEEHSALLMLAYDKLPEGGCRFTDDESSVFSDVAVGWVLGKEAKGFKLVAMATAALPHLSYAGSDMVNQSTAKNLLETSLALQRLEKDFVAKTGRRPRDFATIIVGHYHSEALRVVSSILGLKDGQLHREGRKEFAHTWATDNLVTMSTLEEDGFFSSGDQVLLLNTGAYAWSALLLEKV